MSKGKGIFVVKDPNAHATFLDKIAGKNHCKRQKSCIITHHDVDIFQVQFLGTFSTFGSQIEKLRKPKKFRQHVSWRIILKEKSKSLHKINIAAA